MGNNPYEKKDEDMDFFATEEEKEIQPEKEEQTPSKNPYLNGRYELKEEKSLQKGNNPYMTNRTENVRKPTPPKPKKKNNVVLCIVLSVVFFFVGGLTTWFSLGSSTRSFLKVKFLIENLYYQEIDEDDFYDVVFDAINNDLLDRYSGYLTEDEYQQFLKDSSGERIGTGLAFSAVATGTEELRIVRVSGNSPAEKVGITVGSYILGVGATPDEIVSCSTFDEFAALLSEFSENELFYLRVFEEPSVKTVEIWKEDFIENYVYYRSNTSAYRFEGEKATTLVAGGNPLTALSNDTGYIRLTEFSGNAAKQFEKAMNAFKTEGKTNLVLDLRGNGGGDMNILCNIAQYFCKNTNSKTPLVTKAVYNDYEELYNAPKNSYTKYFKENSRVCVLADNGTASASEALMGCMLDYGTTAYKDVCLFYRNGEAKTYGKGIMQMTLPLLFGKDAMKLTVASIQWPKSGVCIQGRGILSTDGTLTVAQAASDEEEIRNALYKLFTVNNGSIPA